MSKVLPTVLVTLSALFWGANFNAGKFVVGYMPPSVAASVRFSIATLLITFLVLWKESDIMSVVKKNILAFTVLGVIGVAGFNGLFFWGLKYTSPVNGALIMATNPIVTLLLAAIILKNTIQANQKAGMIFSLIGVVIVISNGSISMLSQVKISFGDLIILCANICWALYGVLARRFVKNSSPLITTAVTMGIGTIILLFFSINSITASEILNQDWQVYAALLYMAIFGSVLAYLFWNYGIEHLGASNTSIFFNLVPVFTVIISLVGGGHISNMQILGGVLVLTGVLISSGFIRFPAMSGINGQPRNR
ncbi:DMT family transporter [Legionella sp. CNM-4043-24]|uniref:DMT family transporter n=1 Tax=Legionella sp. CNM-4043-24 TaxID=3421646 RepID=UPI00403A9128